MKKFIVTVLVCFLLLPFASAYELDMSFDDEVRKKYNIEELNNINSDKIVLPKLPDLPEESFKSSHIVRPAEKLTGYDYFPANYSGPTKVLLSGLRLIAVNNRIISDKLKEGTVVSFSTLENINWCGVDIPSGSVLRGKIVSAHTPQMTGNGGLIQIEINELAINKTIYSIDAKLVKVNDLRSFGGKIKGKRRYLANIKQSNKFGINTNKKMTKAARKIERIPVVGILGLVPRAVGVVTVGGNAAMSPFISLFKKGKSVYIPSGTLFEIKLVRDVKIKA